MDSIAALMQNEAAVSTLGILGTLVGVVGFVALGVLSSLSAFVYRLPGGLLSFSGFIICLAMVAFALIATSTMELQYGPAGPVVENSVYAVGVFLIVLGYLRLTLHVLKGRRKGASDAASSTPPGSEEST